MLSTLARRSSASAKALRSLGSVTNVLYSYKSTQASPVSGSQLHNIEGLKLCLVSFRAYLLVNQLTELHLQKDTFPFFLQSISKCL